MTDQPGFSIQKLPVYQAAPPDNAPDLRRLFNDKGELAMISVEPIQFLAFIDFPLHGTPRGNHYHSKKDEYLYLIKGKLRGYFRRANQPDDEIHTAEIEAGSIVHVQPGWTHTYQALETSYAVEYSPTPYTTIKHDTARDPIL